MTKLCGSWATAPAHARGRGRKLAGFLLPFTDTANPRKTLTAMRSFGRRNRCTERESALSRMQAAWVNQRQSMLGMQTGLRPRRAWLVFIVLVATLFVLFPGGQLQPEENPAHWQVAGNGAESPVRQITHQDNPDYRVLAEYLSHRYRVAAEATEALVSAAYNAGRQSGLDPLLILAVIAIESRFNPIAESAMGARGLMQVIPRHHPEKLRDRGGAESLLDPATNIFLGAQILKQHISRTGSLEAGLQSYNGALWDTSNQYAAKVLAVKARLNMAIRNA